MLSKRLKFIADKVKENSNVLDVACDHGLLAIYLEKEKNCNVIGTDIKNSAIEGALRNKKKYNANVKFFVADGLSKLTRDINTVIIAGLGSQTVIEILDTDLKNVNTLIVSVQKDLEDFRRFIHIKGFKIKESLVFDKRYYNVFYLAKGIEKYSNIEYKYGKDLIDNKENINYFKELQKRYENENDEELEFIIKKLSHKD
jgi:ribosomal protein L11 methyltransferase (prmA)